MKLSIPSVLLFVSSLVSCAYASPLSLPRETVAVSVNKPVLADTNTLVERHYKTKYPIECTETLATSIMTNVRADLYANVFGSITSSFCDKIGASLQVKSALLGGLFKIGDARVKTIQAATIEHLKLSFDAELHAQVQANIYSQLEVYLKQSLGTSISCEAKLLAILTKFQTKAKATIALELPKVQAALTLKATAHVDAAIKKVQVNVPLLAHVSVNVGACTKTTVQATVKAALNACAKIEPKVSALAILKKCV